MENSWIKIHRKMLDWCWYKDMNTKCLFIHLLLRVNFQDGDFMGRIIMRGQRFTSVRNLAGETGLTDKQVRTALDKLQKGKQIDIQTASNGTTITVCKYDEYQFFEKQAGKRRANKGDLEGQQYKKDKEEDTKTWKNDFDTYRIETATEFNRLQKDTGFVKKLESYYPTANIIKSMEASFLAFWGTKAGWKNKKDSKCENPDWSATLIGTIKKNLVYKTKEELANERT